MPDPARPSRWPWLAIIGLALVEPLSHLWLKYGLSGDVVHSGFRIGDTPFFLTAMNIFSNDFYSPYVTCQSSAGAHNPWLFALPHHGIYAALGWVARAIHLDPFLLLGVANGLSGAFYLWMALRFLRYAAPQRAHLAFGLLCFGGGLGGAVWLASLALGMQTQPGFELWFHRLARYELIEGPFLAPLLVFPRLYYTLSLGMGFAAIMAFMGSMGRENTIPDKRAMLLQFLCTYVNARVGLLFWGVAVCFMLAQPLVRPAMKWRYCFYYLLPTLMASLLVYIPFGMNVQGAENVADLLRRSAWAGSLLTATFWLWPLVFLAIWRHVGQMGWSGRLIAGWCAGYGAIFFLLYAGHQLWYGNVLGGGDTAAAIAVSDWALLGLIPGMLLLLRRRRGAAEEASEHWVTLWFLGLACVSVAAVGQGWFMRLMPERGLVLLGVPMALLAAEGLGLVRARFPRAATVWTTAILVCGAASIGVSALCFQGPLGHTPGKSPFGWVHSELVRAEDLALIDRLGEGTLLAPASLPPLMGDVAVSRRTGVKTIFGQPSLEFGDLDMLSTAREIQQFFSPDGEDEFRAYFVQDWCVDFILCPATRPVDPSVVEHLSRLPWLERIAQEGDAVLFRVLIDTRPDDNV